MSDPGTADDAFGCIFCLIVAGDAERSVVYEDDATLAFMDIYPAAPGHLVVVPKRHAPQLGDMSADDGAAVMRTAMACAGALRSSGLRTDGINLFLADGAAAGQEVFHAHMHVLPRFSGDGFVIHGSPAGIPDRSTLDDHATEIAAHLG